MIWLWISMSLAAPVSELPERPVVPDQVAASVPDEFAELRTLLLAFHADVLPSMEVVAGLGGVDALIWLATRDPLVVVRERALLVLGRSDRSTQGAAVCVSSASAGGIPRVQAAALRCLAREDLVDNATARRHLVRALHQEDPRLVLAAVAGLAASESGREHLSLWSEEVVLPAVVQDAVRRELSAER